MFQKKKKKDVANKDVCGKKKKRKRTVQEIYMSATPMSKAAVSILHKAANHARDEVVALRHKISPSHNSSGVQLFRSLTAAVSQAR